MTLGDLFGQALDNGFPIDDNNDYELLTADGLPITGFSIDAKEGVIYLSDTEEGVTIL